MKTKILSLIPVLAVALLTAGLASGESIPVVEFNSADLHFYWAGNYLTAGWSFATNEAIDVTALDAYDPNGDGYVQLYDGSGNVLANANLTTSDAQQGSPTLFYTQTLATPVLLVADTTYYITEDICGSDSCPGVNGGLGTLYDAIVPADLVVDPSITVLGGVSANGAGATPFTGSNIVGDFFTPGSAFFGPNFDATPAPSAPEPSTLLMGLTASLVLAALRRRQSRIP